MESQVDGFSPQEHHLPEGLHVIAYGATLDVSRELVAYVASLLAARRRARGTRRRSRALSCGKQALFALVWFRKREDLTVLAAGFGISRVYQALPMKMMLVDEQAALLPLGRTGMEGALLIRAPVIVGTLRMYFELLWNKAVPVDGGTNALSPSRTRCCGWCSPG